MHKEYKHIVESSDKAVLFIHGIVGTPNHFEDFVNLMPKEISVYNLLLDGHGKGVRDFSKASMEKWESQVADAVKELEEHHKEVYVVAHSLGCLLAMEQSVAHSKISKMFLLAVPLKLFLKPRMISTSMKVYFNKVNPEDERTIAAKRCCGIEHSKNPF
jgi:esterase/lipase